MSIFVINFVIADEDAIIYEVVKCLIVHKAFALREGIAVLSKCMHTRRNFFIYGKVIKAKIFFCTKHTHFPSGHFSYFLPQNTQTSRQKEKHNFFSFFTLCVSLGSLRRRGNDAWTSFSYTEKLSRGPLWDIKKSNHKNVMINKIAGWLPLVLPYTKAI